jgi:hypothetical protein
MLYERLNNEMRSTVDHYVVRLRSLTWRDRTSLLAGATAPFEEQFDDCSAELAARGFLTAVLERLGSPDLAEVDDPHQAYLMSRSLLPAHRTLGEQFLSENPDLKQTVEQGLRRRPLVN